MIRVLINDGIHPTGLKMLQDAGYQVDTDKIAQDDLPSKLPEYDAICVRSATKVRAELIDQCSRLKVIGRGGVGLDNIDVDYARGKGIAVVNTPAASSRSVAELVFAHLMTGSRFLHRSNQEMPTKGTSDFGKLKKSYAKGQELEGKTMGIIGFGRIGQETARIALGLGMDVIAHDMNSFTTELQVGAAALNCKVSVSTTSLEEVLAKADVLSLHVPFTGKPLIGSDELSSMKDGAIIINASRGGTIDEDALLDALNSGKLNFVGLDVYENEPNPRTDLLTHANTSVSPHIGASTTAAQEKIGIQLAEQLIEILG